MSDALVGQTLSHFLVQERIGQGGMGIVYRAMDQKLRRTVALKLLPPEVMKEPHRRARFLREAYSAAQISHAHIATIYEVGESGDYVFIAMEYVEGKTLHQLIQEGGLTLQAAIGIARDIASGLARAHEKGIIHRDLKPANVMVTADREVKILDFGLAKLYEPDMKPSGERPLEGATASMLTEVGLMIGSPGYMSPEQAMGKPVDRRSDIFSFGVLLYELFTGRPPFGGRTSVEKVVLLCRDEHLPPSTHNPAIPSWLEQMIHTCMAKQAEGRYASARELVTEFDARMGGARSGSLPLGDVVLPPFVSPSGTEIPPTLPSPIRAPPPADVRRRLLPWALGAGAVLLALVLALPRLTREPTPPPPTAVAQPEAVRLYAEAQRAWRANTIGACRMFGEASKKEPMLAQAHLYSAICNYINPSSARESYQRAVAVQGLLSERDQLLLEAFEPILQRIPADVDLARRRLRAATLRFPEDAELALFLAGVEEHFDFHEALKAVERAAGLDPKFVRVWRLHGELRAYLGDFEGAHRSLQKCLEQSASATTCLWTRISIDSELGNCAAVEGDARRWLTVEKSPTAYQHLADALWATGSSLGAVEQAFRQKHALIPDSGERAKEEHRDAVRLALLRGDFTAALASLQQLEVLLAESTRQDDHSDLASLVVGIHQEIGQRDEAARRAQSFLDRRDAWEPNPRSEDSAISHDATGRMLAVMRRARVISPEEAERRLNERLTWWTNKTPAHMRNYLWIHLYASAVETPEEGQKALAALEHYQPIPPHRPFVPADAYIGQALLRGGRVDDALPALERMVKSCHALQFPLESVHTHALLGQAREARGDTEGACKAYATVLERWGSARPRSLTAERARQRAYALRCPRRP